MSYLVNDGIVGRFLRRFKEEFLVVLKDGTLVYWKIDECAAMPYHAFK